MNTEGIIAINLGIFLVAAIVIGIGTYRNELQYRQRLKRLVHDLKDKLDEALKKNSQLEARLANGAGASAAVEEHRQDISREPGLNHALNSLRQQLQMRDQKIKLLEEYNSRNPASQNPGELGDIVEDMRHELQSSQTHVEALEREVADNQILRHRITQLTREESRYRSMADQLREKLGDARRKLAEMLHLSKKSVSLQNDNDQLYERVDELSSKNIHLTAERDSLSAMYNELANKENYQRTQIEMLEQRLEQSRSASSEFMANSESMVESEPMGDSELLAKIDELEAELDEVRNELERTLKEKTMVETHMISMDRAASTLDQREAELARLKKEHETLEMHFLLEQGAGTALASGGDSGAGATGDLEFQAQDRGLTADNVEFLGQRLGQSHGQSLGQSLGQSPGQSKAQGDLFERAPNKSRNPEVFDSPLFASISEFWEKFIDAKEEVAILSTSVPNKPARLSLWTYVWIGNEDLGIILGLDRDLSERVTSILFDKPQASLLEEEVVDSVGEMTNIVAGFVANNLGDSRELSAPMHIAREELDQLMFYMKTTAEILVGTSDGRLYLGTITKNL